MAASEVHVADSADAEVELRSLIPENHDRTNDNDVERVVGTSAAQRTTGYPPRWTLWVMMSLVFFTWILIQRGGDSANDLLSQTVSQQKSPRNDSDPIEETHPAQASPDLVLTSSIPFREPSDRTRLQIENYRKATALILNVHITHHGGTTFCSAVGRASNTVGASPAFACMGVTNTNVTADYPKEYHPWKHNETAKYIAIVRKYFHMISWEYRRPPSTPIAETDFEDPNLLSVIIMRHPIKRLLAGNGWVWKTYPGIYTGNATHEQWWEYAQTPHGNTNNYALHVLAGKECCDGENTDPKHLQAAKDLVSRFSIVLDIECLIEGMQALTDLLDIKMRKPRKKEEHGTPRERIPYDDVYDYLLRRNKLDIELYEWSKSLALVNCSALLSSVSD